MSASRAPGRPRLAARRRDGESGREEILDAAAQLFTEQGYAATSTRAIALAVGVRQASLYYHFPSKADMLVELLRGTVEPSLAVAAALRGSAGSVPARLHALATFDVRLLSTGAWNLGALYLLPELRDERFTGFHAQRQQLRDAYAELVLAGVAAGHFQATQPLVTADLVFALVESVISIRSQRPAAVAGLDELIPDCCLRVLTAPVEREPAVRRDSGQLMAALPDVPPPIERPA